MWVFPFNVPHLLIPLLKKTTFSFNFSSVPVTPLKPSESTAGDRGKFNQSVLTDMTNVSIYLLITKHPPSHLQKPCHDPQGALLSLGVSIMLIAVPPPHTPWLQVD